MKTESKLVWVIIIVLYSLATSYAWYRNSFSDKEIASRAEYIVIGKIKEKSLVLINHPSWREFHVDLVILEVLKGQIASNSMVVSIHHGLAPIVGGVDAKNMPKDAVALWDTGNSQMPVSPICRDLRTNQIWLLRREKIPQLDNSDWIGIYDPEDVQPLAKKDALLKWLK